MDTATVQYFVGLLFIACLITTTTKLRVIKNLVWDFVGELLAMLTVLFGLTWIPFLLTQITLDLGPGTDSTPAVPPSS